MVESKFVFYFRFKMRMFIYILLVYEIIIIELNNCFDILMRGVDFNVF